MTEEQLEKLLGSRYYRFKANEEWWRERQANTQANLTNKSIKDTEKQLIKYYKQCMENVIGQFELTYKTYLLNVQRGLESSPATLYKLDAYWQAQVKLREELQKLGDKQTVLYSKGFTQHYKNIYRSVALHDGNTFSDISQETAQQMINSIWCADGSTWKSRIWKNTDMLQQALNDGLIECVVSGTPSDRLKSRLMEEFNVSFSRADNLVRTELAHIQTQAARDRYAAAGVKEVQVWADKDERQCSVCGKLHKQKFPVGGAMPIPAHPRCRCTIIPVIEVEPEPQLKLDGF